MAHETRHEVVGDILDEVSALIAASRSRWQRLAHEVEPELYGSSLVVLHTLRKRGSASATELCQALDTDKAVMSRQIARLRSLGLVDERPCPHDGRVTLLTLSEEAGHKMARISTAWADLYRSHMDTWSEEDLQALLEGLRRFNADAVAIGTDTADQASPHVEAAPVIR